MHWKNTSTEQEAVKKHTHTKQNNGIYNTCHGLLSQILIVIARYSLRFSHAHWCYSDKTESISSILRKIAITTPKKKQQQQQQQLNHPPSHTIMEDTIRHNIAQMTSTSKAYIPCLLATIIK